MTYASEVLADSPWGFWKLDEASGSTFADASGNGHPLSITGSPSLGVAGPTSELAAAAAFPDGSGSAQYGSLSWASSPATVECWFRVEAIDPSGTWLIGGSTSGGNDKHLYLDASGYLTWYVYNGAARYTKSAAPVSTGVWHHVVASVGAAGTKIRLDKAAVGGDASITSSYPQSQYFNVHNGAASGNIPNASGAVTIAAVAAYPAQLSDARTDAHYDAAIPPAPVVTLTSTSPQVTGSFAVTVSTPPVTGDFTGTAPGVVGSFDGSVAVEPVSADLAGNAPAVTGSFAIEIAGAVTADLSGAAPAVSGSFAGTSSGPPIEAATDSVNRANGMTLVTEWDVSVEPPVATAKRQRGHDNVIATSLPDRTLVDGRPV